MSPQKDTSSSNPKKRPKKLKKVETEPEQEANPLKHVPSRLALSRISWVGFKNSSWLQYTQQLEEASIEIIQQARQDRSDIRSRALFEIKKRISPTLSAIMCDGMGWFSELDYKRILLTYDRVYYLLPKNVVEFNDITGTRQFLYFPTTITRDPSFRVHHYIPDEKRREVILEASKNDILNRRFLRVIRSIPTSEQIYTWRVINADGDLGTGRSLGLRPNQDKLAHAILLNKFLLAADELNCIPISGKPYIHGLISEKYISSVHRINKDVPGLLPVPLKLRSANYNPVVKRLISALVPDEELEKRSKLEIMSFKEKNWGLFENYSYTTRYLVDKIGALSIDPNFDIEVQELINTEVWKEKEEIEKELHSAWEAFFKSVITSTVSGLAAIGIAPFLSLGAITLATAATATTAIAPWALTELFKFVEARNKAKKHGLYYLMKFAD